MDERGRHAFALIAGHYQQSFAVTSPSDRYFIWSGGASGCL